MAKKSQIVIAETPEELDAATAAAAGNSDAPSAPSTTAPEIHDLPADGAPLEVQNPLHPTAESLKGFNELRADIHAKQRSGITHPLPHAGLTRYESRIRIAEAWQYTGSLATAPDWIDRSWAAWGDHDPVRGIEQGPALRVPTPNAAELDKLCRRGDYVVRQEVTLALGVDPDIQVEVWEKEHFEKFFLPSRPGLAKPEPSEVLKQEPENADAAQQP
jgi:hypothetical protein